MAIYTGFAKDKQLKHGNIVQLSWTKEQYEKLGEYFNKGGYINVDLKRGKNGSPYMEINTYNVENVSGDAPIYTPAEDDDVPY